MRGRIKVSRIVIDHILFLFVSLFFSGCSDSQIREINFGYIGPLSVRATDLGQGPSKAMVLAVEQYNNSKKEWEPKINLFVEDDQWEKERSLPAYAKLSNQKNIEVLLISNTGATVALQDSILKDNVICVNSLNSDELLSSLNDNTYTVAKRTEVANGLVGHRIVEKKLKNVVILHYPNDFMTRGALAVKKILDNKGIKNRLVQVVKGNTDFKEELKQYQLEGCDGLVFFGYKNFGFAMKQARDLGMEIPFFGSTTLLDPDFHLNSEGAIIGTEFPFFLPSDGNEVLATEFIEEYTLKYGNPPYSVWPTLQGYDAINIVIDQIRSVNIEKQPEVLLSDWLREKLSNVTYYEGVCGNLTMDKKNSVRGIYFSLYNYKGNGQITKLE